jgi:hypothetical protein
MPCQTAPAGGAIDRAPAGARAYRALCRKFLAPPRAARADPFQSHLSQERSDDHRADLP